MAAFTGSYATVADFKEQAPEIDLDGWGVEDPDLLAMLTRASRVAETFASQVFGTHTVDEEDHEWRDSRRAYLRDWPVQSIDSITLLMGGGVVGTLDAGAFIISKTYRYVEYSSLALAMSLTPAMMTYGLSEPLMRFAYTAGYTDVPTDIMIAVCIMVASHLIQRHMIEENLGGVISMTIGSYTISVGRPRSVDNELSGFAGVVPPEAAMILRGYMVTHVR